MSTRDKIRLALEALAKRPPEPLTFVAYGDKMEADALEAFKGTGVRVVRADRLPKDPAE